MRLGEEASERAWRSEGQLQPLREAGQAFSAMGSSPWILGTLQGHLFAGICVLSPSEGIGGDHRLPEGTEFSMYYSLLSLQNLEHPLVHRRYSGIH